MLHTPDSELQSTTRMDRNQTTAIRL